MSRAGQTRAIAGPAAIDIGQNRRCEVILVGDVLRNLRLVVFSRSVAPLS